MISVDNLIECVIEWGEDKDIIGQYNILPQLSKVIEETEELEEEIIGIADPNNSQEEIDEITERAKMELGDVLVTLILLAEDIGSSAQECLSMSYEKIKDRKGKTINGTFVKEEDLYEEQSYRS